MVVLFLRIYNLAVLGLPWLVLLSSGWLRDEASLFSPLVNQLLAQLVRW